MSHDIQPIDTAAAQPPALLSTPEKPDCWFSSPADLATLPVGSAQIEIRSELQAGEGDDIFKQIEPSAGFEAMFFEFWVRRSAQYLVSWTLPGVPSLEPADPEQRDDPKKRAEHVLSVVRGLPLRRFERLRKILLEHEESFSILAKLPDLKAHLQPDQFLESEVTLPLPFGQSVTLATDLLTGQKSRIMARLAKQERQTGNDYAFMAYGARIARWTLTYPSGAPVEPSEDALRAMKAMRWVALQKQIETFDKLAAEALENPTFAEDWKKPSASVN